MTKSAPNVGIILIAIGVLLSSGGLYKRIRTEQSNKNIQIIVESPLPAESNVNIEWMLAEWVENSLAGRWNPGLESPFKDFKDNSITFVFNNSEFYEQANNIMTIKLGEPPQSASMNGNYYLRIENIAWSELKKMGMGLMKVEGPLPDVEYPLPNEKRKYIRVVNDKWVSPEYIDWFFKRIDTGGISAAKGIIFKGREVFGYPDYLKEVNEWIKRKKIKLYTIEFAPQKGFKKLASGMSAPEGNVVIRLHSIPTRLPPDRVMRRIVRAVRERNIRAIYLKNPEHIKMIGTIETNLNKAGFKIDTPAGFKILPFNRPTGTIALLIALTGLIIFFRQKVRSRLKLLFIIPLWVLSIAGIFLFPLLLLQLLITAIAVLAPLSAVKYILNKDVGFIKGVSVFFLFSMIAGVLISAAAADASFFVKLQQIRGIKFSLILPIILSVFIVYGSGHSAGGGISLTAWLKKALQRQDVLYIAVFTALAGIYILRSENLYPQLVLSFELKIREFLEKVFIFRPRFKEFLFGHPLLITGLYFLKYNSRLPSGIGSSAPKILIIAGLTGQLSIINTFMHIHSPFLGSVIRTFWGIILGAIASGVLIIILNKWLPEKE